ncbi:hypothetical protein ES703_25990 [subsurface metagenome]
MKPSDSELTNDDIIEYNLQLLPKVKNIEPTYSIVTRARNYNIKGGDSIEIDIYLTGLGIPAANKLVIVWSSPNIIDASSPGVATYSIQEATKRLNGKNMIAPVAGKEFIDHYKLDPNGVTIHLNKGYFLPVPKYEAIHMPQIVGERIHEGYPPISISLKTLRKAKSGDYKIDSTLTYIYHNITKQASDKVEFRITNWWDRNQWWVITLGSIIAFILLVLTVINIWFPIAG